MPKAHPRVPTDRAECPPQRSPEVQYTRGPQQEIVLHGTVATARNAQYGILVTFSFKVLYHYFFITAVTVFF